MSEQQLDTEKFLVGDEETVYRLISSPAGYNEVTGVSPDHAGIQMLLSGKQVYKNTIGEPTPMEILALQTYLSGIVNQVIKNGT